ncbi:MAG TPA: metallophosphoesterase [Nitrolancea sp.]|nr:metallophosphoesterase [Nitrolancea sp.]
MILPASPETFETPLTVAVIADTHFGAQRIWLPDEVLDALQRADLIVHAGDFCSVEAYEMLSAIGPLRAVLGNNDVAALRTRLPLRREFQFGPFRAGLIHGHGFGRLTAREAADQLFSGQYDLGIFGHSHRPYHEMHDGTILFNPGSPTNRRWEPRHSYGIIRIADEIHAELRYLP